MWTVVLKYLPYIAGALALGFVVYEIDSFGYHRAEDKVTAKYEAQISEINLKSAQLLEKQIKEHNEFVERQDKLVNDLMADKNKLDRIIKENELEAAKDTHAKRPAVSKSSVLRLNRIR